MFDKYLKIFSADKKSEAAPEPEVIAFPHPQPIPLLKPLPPATDSQTWIEPTAETAVITDMLDIPTHGKRSEGSELLTRFLGRRPVLDRQGEVIGYEIRCTKSAALTDQSKTVLTQMADEMLLASIEALDTQKLRGGKQLFITLHPSSLSTAFLERIDGKGITLIFTPPPGEVSALISRCQELHARGYRFALEELQYREDLDELLALADTIRLNPAPFDAVQLGALAVQIKSRGDFQLLADPVESEELFKVCHKLGFSFFQGYFFMQPLPASSKAVDGQRLHVMQLLNQTLNHAEISELEKGFKRDPVLSYKLLRFINSPANRLMQPVRSIAHALVVLGYDQLYRWLTLLLFASGQADHRTLALMNNALVRARLTELLGAKKLKPQEQEGLFITGIFSLLDALLNMSMANALASLKLPDAIAAALLKREGLYAPFLELAIACEQAEEQVVSTYAASLGITAEEINIAHVQSLVWAEEVDLGKA